MTKALFRAAAFARASLAEERGSVAIMIGVALSVLLGMVALGTEVTFVVYKHRQMQSAADSAALGSAVALSKGYPADYALEGKAIAATAGFVSGADGVTVTVNNPPVTGNNTATAGAVEVIIAQPQTLKLTSILSSAAFEVTARSVALKGANGSFCVMTTDTSSAVSMDVGNGAYVNLNQCGAAVNGGGSKALSVTGGATLNALSATVVGQTRVSNGGVLTATNGVLINQPATADPYASVTVTPPAGCNHTNKSLNWSASTQTLSPGTYCNGLTIGNSAQVIMNPGIYYIKSGTFNVGGGSTVNGTGVTIVLTNNSNTSYATADVGNGATVTLSAPTSGALSGIVIFGDRSASTSGTNKFVGGSTNNYTGAIYTPSQRLEYSNGTNTAATCTQLIVWRVEFSGGASFNNDCDSAGTSAIGGGAATTLVE